MKLLWARVVLAGALVALGVQTGKTAAVAPPVEEKIIVPPALLKSAPEGVADLKAIQNHVKMVLKKTMPATVAIVIADPLGRGMAAGSGVIITSDGYVLTAGHISQKPNQRCQVILPGGKRLRGETLGWNKARDAGLIKIIDKGKWPNVKMGDSAKLKPGEWCLCVGHPGGYKPGRPAVVRLGRVLINNRFVQTDTPLMGGDSGGPLFDMTGKVIGIHSWIREAINANNHVPVNVYRDDWERLLKSEEYGGPGLRASAPAYLGVIFERDLEDLKVLEIPEGGPAAKAGLQPGDILLQINNQKLDRRSDLVDYLQKKKPGDEVTLEYQRDGKAQKVKITLVKRPTED
jgi:serine protease Do